MQNRDPDNYGMKIEYREVIIGKAKVDRKQVKSFATRKKSDSVKYKTDNSKIIFKNNFIRKIS